MNPDVIKTDRCASAFDRMFWAFVFFIDFRIGINNVHVDILPDFIGWLMIVSALTSIQDLSPAVKSLKTLAWWLVILSLFDLIEIRIPTGQRGYVTQWISPMFLVGIVAMILDIALIWKLCGMIIEMATVVGDYTIRGRADFRRQLYVGLVICTMLLVVIAFAAPQMIVVAVVGGLAFAIIVFCLMMGLMKGTADMCRAARGSAA